MISKAEEYYNQENYREAENTCLQIMGSGENSIDVLRLQSLIMLKTNRVQQGLEFLKLALEQDPNGAANNIALAHYSLALENIPAAINSFLKAHQTDPRNTETLMYLADLHVVLKDWNKAVVFYALHINIDASNVLLNQLYANILERFEFKQYSDVQRQAMENILLDRRVNPRKMYSHWIYMVANLPEYKVFNEAVEKQSFDLDVLQPCLNATFFSKGIERLRQKTPAMEVTLTKLRKEFLGQFNKGHDLSDHKNFLFSLSMQSWVNEYAFYADEDEGEWITILKEKIEGKVKSGEIETAIPLLYLYSCYDTPMNIGGIESCIEALRNMQDCNLTHFTKIQIQDALDEKEIKKTIPIFTDIDDEISMSVQSMYEESPYPRGTDPVVVDERKTDDNPYNILFAGCGTGFQVVGFAQQYPNSKFTGVDLSASSLAYAIRQTSQSFDFEEGQMRYGQADILKLDQLPDRYDRIFCTGVLHHMDEPEKGLAVLKNILKDNGEMRLAFYSEVARKEIVQARDYIAEHGYGQSNNDIRKFRHDILNLAFQDNHPDFINFLVKIPDFYTLSECRDLVFHVQEHRYTIPQLLDMLDRHDLELTSFNIKQASIKEKFLKEFPDEDAILNPVNWQKYEQKYPYAFVEMYDFNVRHKR